MTWQAYVADKNGDVVYDGPVDGWRLAPDRLVLERDSEVVLKVDMPWPGALALANSAYGRLVQVE